MPVATARSTSALSALTGPLVIPDVSLDPVGLCDLELALLGVLEDDALLGAPLDIRSAPVDVRPEQRAGGPAHHRSSRVRLAMPQALAEAVARAGAAVLRDEESTPLARLEVVEWVGEVEWAEDVELLGGARTADEAAPSATAVGPPGDVAVVRGSLVPLRRGEGGQSSQLRLTADDLGPAPAQRLVIVLGRPPMAADLPALRGATRAHSGPVLLVVAAGPPQRLGGVPAAVMVPVAQALAHDLGVADRARIRTAPLAWREPASDAHRVGLLTQALDAAATIHLPAHGSDVAALRWQEVRTALEQGADEVLSVPPAVLLVLRRWKPPRRERGLVVLFSGLSGSGKSTLARDLAQWVTERGERTLTMLDGDVVRQMLSSGLGFDRASRELNVRRIGFVAAEIARHGGIAVAAPIAPYACTRAEVRRLVDPVGDLVLVHVSTPLEECERRDLKGHYAKARAGLIPEFTGISDPYEEPADADLHIDTSTLSRQEALSEVVGHLCDGGWLGTEHE